MKYSRSVFTSVAIFSSHPSICLLGKKLYIKYSLGLADWLGGCCQNCSNKKLNVVFYFSAYVKLPYNVRPTSKLQTPALGSLLCGWLLQRSPLTFHSLLPL